MYSPIEDQLLKNAAAAAFQLVWEPIKVLGGKLWKQEEVQRGMLRYAEQFLGRRGQVRVLNMAAPVPLRNIYVAAQVLPRAVQERFSSLDRLHEQYAQQHYRSLLPQASDETRCDCLQLANNVKFLSILGAPGAGKSTFLKRLGLEALLPRRSWKDSILTSFGLKPGLDDEKLSSYNHDCLPVLIELRDFRTHQINLVELIVKELKICGLPELKELAVELLRSGRLLLLLDGVDEMPGDRLDEAIRHIGDFVDEHSCNRFVLSCRTAFYKNYFTRFNDWLLADFNDEQIANFIRNWFCSEHDREAGTAEGFLEALNEPTNASAKELASTPLLLTFLCLHYDALHRLPRNRGQLYQKALEILLERWAADKRVHNKPLHGGINPALEVQMLTEIAAPAFQESRYFFTRRELLDRITRFLHGETKAPRDFDAAQVLKDIEGQQGLIVQRAQDAWSFSHLTIQEHLTATWYVESQKLEEFVSKHLFDKRWREVFILTAGIVGKADGLLERMQRTASKVLMGQPWAVQLLQWIVQKSITVGDEQRDAGRRALNLSLGFVFTRARARASVRARAIKLNRSLARDRDGDIDINRALGLIHNRDDRDEALASSLDIARTLDFDLACALDFARTLDFDIDSTSDRALNFDRVPPSVSTSSWLAMLNSEAGCLTSASRRSCLQSHETSWSRGLHLY